MYIVLEMNILTMSNCEVSMSLWRHCVRCENILNTSDYFFVFLIHISKIILYQTDP